MKNKEASLQWILGASCLAALFIYVFFFLFLPQSWTLNNDYGVIKFYTRPDVKSLWDEIQHIVSNGMNEGRFMVLWWSSVVLRYLYLPIKPALFNLINLGLGIIALTAFTDFLKNLKLSRIQILLALTMLLTAFTMKDWIAYTACAEPLAITFLCIALALYRREKKWPALLFFTCSFLSKESFFAAAPTFLFLEYLDYKRKKTFNWPILIAFTLIPLAFVGYVKSLPQVYTAGKFAQFTFKGILKALILPPLKCYGPFLLLVGHDVYQRKQWISKESFAPVGLGSIIVLVFSIFLSGWGEYDSWSYLHMFIPFGWALILAGLWQPATNPQEKIQIGLTLASCLFGLLITINGSFNLWTFFANAKTTAEIACSDYKQTPDLKIFTNCQEGAVQLANYLALSGQCTNLPEIKWMPTGSLPANTQAPYEMLLASRWCTPYDTSMTAPSRIELRHWTILKNLNK
ncbi:MAG: hypothetical protein SGI74_09240 [Oligoflexia bacterium]|nr:hypothetical protein [Oligoflexia bacterium]